MLKAVDTLQYTTELPCPLGDTTSDVNQDRMAEIYKAAFKGVQAWLKHSETILPL
jgi:hypothetical protein